MAQVLHQFYHFVTTIISYTLAGTLFSDTDLEHVFADFDLK